MNFRMFQCLLILYSSNFFSPVAWWFTVRDELSRQKEMQAALWVGVAGKGLGGRAPCDLGDPETFALCRSGRVMCWLRSGSQQRNEADEGNQNLKMPRASCCSPRWTLTAWGQHGGCVSLVVPGCMCPVTVPVSPTMDPARNSLGGWGIRSYSKLNMAHHDGEGSQQEVGAGCKISGWPTSSS